ncbi:MAG TPA: hypothetical protein VKT00_12615, partial [Casimicrobiaceae bacterium]|nr:hypothetical protein [Casimicrobiaceae bacterium]
MDIKMWGSRLSPVPDSCPTSTHFSPLERTISASRMAGQRISDSRTKTYAKIQQSKIHRKKMDLADIL